VTTAGRRPEIRPFETADLNEAGRLLAERHRRQRAIEPGLPVAFEDPVVAGQAIAGLLASDGSTGTVAVRDGRLIGYVVGTSRPPMWGANVWVEGAGHAVADGEAEVIRDLYGAAAAGWVAGGRTSHYIMVPATDPAVLDAWARVGFGAMHTHAIREVPGPGGTRPATSPGVTVRAATMDDVPVLAPLDLVLAMQHAASPVFSSLPMPTLAEATADWTQSLGDPSFGVFAAVLDGVLVGAAVGCSVERSNEHSGIARPDGGALLNFAAVLPEAQGLGIGQALGWRVLEWARDEGYPTVTIDWRETNLLASRAWPRLGFRPTFRRLYRAIA
jgi:GNAT superfamily N-acetyltransferase